ncbi:MAG: DUF262 domain-containing protein [Candidatus Helarchaeota archaeon]
MTKIDGDRIEIKDLFSNFWFNVPEYQRNYVWETEQINKLLDDLVYAFKNNKDDDYFLGPLVLQEKESKNYKEYDILDGQQRLTTLTLLFAVLRDLTDDEILIKICNKFIYQEENRFIGIPAKLKLNYVIREDVREFLNNYVKEKNGTNKIIQFEKSFKNDNISTSNMINAINFMRNYDFFKFKNNLLEFAQFLFQKVVFIYIKTKGEFEDAYRLFTILNNRGIPLRNSDILKAFNIGVINNKVEKKKYSKKWEEIVNSFKDEGEFDRFLSYIRTILVKEKARKNLLAEFEENIYKKNLLRKGIDTIEFLSKYQEHYEKIIELYGFDIGNEYKNLITIMRFALPSTDWIPPLLLFYEKFRENDLYKFLRSLEFKFVGDWILQTSPTIRLANINKILKVIEEAKKTSDVLNNSEIFEINKEELREILNKNIYGKKFARYILLKREFLLMNNETIHFSGYKYLSIEHILPQNPKPNSQWTKDFSPEEIKEWKDKIGNLILISKKKNSKLSNLDFNEKKKRYLKGRIDPFPSNRLFNQYKQWTIDEIKKRQKEIVDCLVNNN